MPACLLILAVLSVSSSASSNETVLREAESAFDEAARLRDRPAEARPLFRRAAERYTALHDQGIRSPALYLSQGNAWLLAGELPQAILAYRRGLQLDPNDPDLQRNLAFARSQVLYPATSRLGRPAADHWPPWLPGPTPEPLIVLTALLAALGWVGLTRWRMTRRAGYGWISAGAFTAALLAASSWGLVQWQDVQARRHPLVVIVRDGVHLAKGNGTAYPVRYPQPLNRGVEARQLFERGGWLQIQLAAGEVGWVPGPAVLVDTP